MALLEKHLVEGESVWPYLSDQIAKDYRPDMLLNNWGIHHLHLGSIKRKDGFIQRTNDVLFCRFEEPWLTWAAELGILTMVLPFMGNMDGPLHLPLPREVPKDRRSNVYFIKIGQHGDWFKQELLEIMHDNWPEAIEMHRMHRVPMVEQSDEDIQRNFKRNVNTLINIRGTTYAPLASGTNEEWTTSLDALFEFGLELAHKSQVDEVETGHSFGIEDSKKVHLRNWNSSFRIALISNDDEKIKSLFAPGTVPDVGTIQRIPALREAAYYGSVTGTLLLLEAGADPNRKNVEGAAPIHVATLEGHNRVLKALLRVGANPDAQLKDGVAPLHMAVMCAGTGGGLTVLTTLIKVGANPNIQDLQGKTPMHLAVNHGWLDVAEFLKDCGANPETKDKSGLKPFDIANHPHIPESMKAVLN